MLLCTTVPLFAQNDNLSKDINSDLNQTDTLAKKSLSGLNSEVTYSAADSVVFDPANNVIYLYGKARLIYEDFELDADFIKLDQKDNTISARGSFESISHKYSGRPIFKSSTEAPSVVDSLVYNYKTKKGKVYGGSSEVEGGFIYASQIKKNQYGEAFILGGIYSTCDLPPDQKHFGIHISRGIVTQNQIVTGPAYLIIEGVPLPIGLPFAFFPKANKRASGLLFPTFGEDFARGFFMRDLGYYIGLNDYWDMALRTTLYSKGSYEANAIGSYRKNYKFDGRINLRFASTRTGVEGTPGYKPSKDFNIQWSHSQSPEANPGTTFSASVNIGTSSYFSRTAAGGTYSLDQLTRNSLSSSISYGRTFADGLFNFTSSLSHRQDITTKNIFLELPSFNLNMSTITPFASRDQVGEEKWYQKISVGYSLQGSNSIDTKEDLLFKSGSLQKFRSGFQHSIPVNLSLNAFRFFQFSTGIQYSEKWYLQTIRKNFDPARNAVVKDTVNGFSRAYDYSVSTGLSTKVYGIKNFRRGKLLALRHVMTPSVNFSYRPDFGDARYGFYRNVQTNSTGNVERYSIFEDGIYGSPGIGKVAALGFSIDNNIEAKVRSKSDTTTAPQKISILQSLSFSGNYNFAADSFKLSSIGFAGRTALFKQTVGVNFYGTLDPYKLNSSGQRIDRFTFRDGKLARLTNVGLSFDFSLNSTAAKSRSNNLNNLAQNTTARTPEQTDQLLRLSRDPNAFLDFNIPWNVTASYSFNYSKSGLQSNITNTINLYGDLNVTPKWKVQYNSGYDFHSRQISITQFSIYRDLHCWDMSFHWVPFGTYRSYSFDLRVRASILQDLKLSRRRDYYNNY